MNLKIVIFLLSTINFIYAGFSAETQVKTDKDHIQIQLISDHNNIVNFDLENNHSNTSKLIHIFTIHASTYYHIHLANDTIICSENQKFYDPQLGKWIKAKDINQESYFLDYYGNNIPCIQIDRIHTAAQSIDLYEITLEKPHTYFVSKCQILAHNFAPIVIGLSWALGEGITLTGGGIGLGALGWGLWQKFGNNQKLTFAQIQQECINNTTGGAPDPDDENSLKNRRKKAERLAKEMGFKEIKDYKFDSHGEKVFRKGNIEISLDKESHNGGFWKIFLKKTNNRLGTYNETLNIKIKK